MVESDVRLSNSEISRVLKCELEDKSLLQMKE